jgi:hypothetical protein
VLEIFTFLQMGGDFERVTLVPFALDSSALRDLRAAFCTFDVVNATCFKEEVRAHRVWQFIAQHSSVVPPMWGVMMSTPVQRARLHNVTYCRWYALRDPC